jgi:hypothetical protein
MKLAEASDIRYQVRGINRWLTLIPDTWKG